MPCGNYSRSETPDAKQTHVMAIPFLFQLISALQFAASGAHEELFWINWGKKITGEEII